MTPTDTRTALLVTARELLQARGYNGFSFRDLAERVGVTTASIHYHFPTKGHLGLALVEENRRAAAAARADLDVTEADPWRRLRRFAGTFRATLADGYRMCLCGMLAVEYRTLPPDLVREVRRFYDESERWLARTLLDGRKAGAVAFDGPAAGVARGLFAALEGALVSARAFEDLGRFDEVAAALLSHLRPRPAPARG